MMPEMDIMTFAISLNIIFKRFLECNWRYDSSLSFHTSYFETDNAQSDAKRIIQKMAEAVSYGGGFMLNMHLDKNCQIYAYDKEIINNIGDWLKKTALRYTVPHVLLF